MIQLAGLHINSEHPQAMSRFYTQLLGLEPAWSSDEVTGFMVGDFRLEIAKHTAVSGRNQKPERQFFDLMVDDVAAEFERIVALGASVVQEPYEFAEGGMRLVIATLADPDGNYFQLVAMQ